MNEESNKVFNRIALGNDHAGYECARKLALDLKKEGFEVIECGSFSAESSDYPVYANKVCEQIRGSKADAGILVCGTGIGMAIAANKRKGIRAAVCTDGFQAKICRTHNDANVLCLGARINGYEEMKGFADIFLRTSFLGGRHAKRVAMIMRSEENDN